MASVLKKREMAWARAGWGTPAMRGFASRIPNAETLRGWARAIPALGAMLRRRDFARALKSAIKAEPPMAWPYRQTGPWFAARFPERVDAAVRGETGGPADRGDRAPAGPGPSTVSSHAHFAAHLSMVLGKGSAGKGLVQPGSGGFTASIVRKYFEDRPKRPLCHVWGMEPWPIAVDEALDARHPAAAMAWMMRAAAAEASADAALMARFSQSLARSMAGFFDPDGLHPDFAKDVEDCRWADLRIEAILAKAVPIASALVEAMELRVFCASLQEEPVKKSLSLSI